MKKPKKKKWKAAIVRFEASGNSYYLSGRVTEFHKVMYTYKDLIDKINIL